MKSLILISYLMLLVCTVKSQPDSSVNILKISPIILLMGDYVTNSINVHLAFEKKLNKMTTIQQEVGYIKNLDALKNILTINTEKINGLHFDTEIRRYLKKNKKSMEGFYLSTNFKTNITKATIGRRNPYEVKRLLIATHINIGWQDISIASPFTFDIVIGGGARLVNSNANIPVDGIILRSFERGKLYADGRKTTTNIRFDIKLGYAF